MTVQELIVKLGEFDPNMPVLVDGYEGGYDDPKDIRVHVAVPRGYRDYSGAFDDPIFDGSLTEFLAVTWISDEEKVDAFEAVVIPR